MTTVPTRAKTLLTSIGDGLLTVLAVLGAVCIALVLAAAIFDVRIILFSTGSMAPTIPAGSAALVRGIPASDIELGDVITVDRPGRLPITHRVVDIAAVDGDPDARSIVMRGDANDVDDPAPYVVTAARETLVAVPGTAAVLVALSSPWVLGPLTVGAAVLVVAVFWPKRRVGPAAPAEARGPRERDGDVQPMGERRRRRAAQRTGTALLVGVALIAASHLGAPPASASERVVQGEFLQLISVDDISMRTMSPGRSGVWVVGVASRTRQPGSVHVSLARDGEGETPLTYRVDACPQRWRAETCEGQREVAASTQLPSTRTPRALGTIRSDEPSWFRIEVTLPSDAADLREPVALIFRATGIGDDVATGGGSGLADAGGVDVRPVLALAAGLTLAGAALLARGRRPA